VLIRAGEPLEEMEQMAQNRYGQKYGQLTKSRRLGLTNGPGKLCRALALDRSLNGADLCGRELYVEEGDGNGAFQITQARRVGIDYAGEAAEYPWRFYVTQSEYVSVR
jgi:DNA-3-methyladenine glycosylase